MGFIRSLGSLGRIGVAKLWHGAVVLAVEAIELLQNLPNAKKVEGLGFRV